MISYYDQRAEEYLHTHKPPKGVILMVKENPEEPGVVYLTTTASNMADIPEIVVHEFVDWINKTTKHLNSLPLMMGTYVYALEHK